jgi:hypothetical protein
LIFADLANWKLAESHAHRWWIAAAAAVATTMMVAAGGDMMESGDVSGSL